MKKKIDVSKSEQYYRQSQWKGEIMLNGWKTLKEFSSKAKIEWDCFREYIALRRIAPPEKAKQIELLIRKGA